MARAGVTFRYTETGPVGMVENTRALVISPRGGMHVGSATDLVTPYMRTVLGFIGIKEVDFIYAEGMGMGRMPRARGWKRPKRSLRLWLSKGSLYKGYLSRQGLSLQGVAPRDTRTQPSGCVCFLAWCDCDRRYCDKTVMLQRVSRQAVGIDALAESLLHHKAATTTHQQQCHRDQQAKQEGG